MIARLFLLLLAILTVANPAAALGRLSTVEVIDRNSHATLPVYYSRGSYWIAGTPGGRYAIALSNTTGGRILAVTSVDGVNVISGETAAVGQTGYVLSPYSRFEVTGWRKSNREVAAFEFTAAPQSYAERTGRPANVGVIGIAVFREAVAPEPPIAYSVTPAAPPSEKAPEAAQADRSAAAPQPMRPSLGTGHGAREASTVTDTEFRRLSDQPDEVIRVRYDSYEHLVAMGVIPRSRVEPQAFPGSPAPGYVPDPPR